MVTKQSPSSTYVFATNACIAISVVAYLFGVWRSDMLLNEQGYYLICLMFGLFSSITVQKVVRDRDEGVHVSEKYRFICWFALGSSLLLFIVGLFNADMAMSEKGFYIMAYLLAMYSSITAQKNEADKRSSGDLEKKADVLSVVEE